MRISTCVLLLAAIAIGQSGCSDCAGNDASVVVYTSLDRASAETLLRSFQRTHRIRVRVLYGRGSVLQHQLSAAHPAIDVFWSREPLRPEILARAHLTSGYLPRASREVPAEYRSPQGRWTAVGADARVLVVNKDHVHQGEMPRSIRDLASPTWEGEIAVSSPLRGTGHAHVALLCAAWGLEEVRRFFQGLKLNHVRIAKSNAEVVRLVRVGAVSIGLTDRRYALAAQREGAPIEVISPDQEGAGTALIPSVVTLLRGAAGKTSARALVDFLASSEAEASLVSETGWIGLRGASAWSGLEPGSTIRYAHPDFARAAAEVVELDPWLSQWLEHVH